MVLTPADVHNVAFSKPRLGKRGYDEQKVDLFVDLVERELIRHLDEEAELRSRCAELGDGLARVRQRETDLIQWETALSRQESDAQRRHGEGLPGARPNSLSGRLSSSRRYPRSHNSWLSCAIGKRK